MYVYMYEHMCMCVSFSFPLATKSVSLANYQPDYTLQLGHWDARKHLC